ncbi:X-linked retinitis pigmentosa GTPase regulator-interacting protein 1 isoform X7 [Acipenser ruthenus]|uniref:X-linked retinitis pigmentosa GTPase regulator-interacting protein 1 isoform X7 n=1 Tax=Acipenser ruthenus TaxID=7906 RepID=UPI0027407076|nr:X-linked retinitis pigmentosa GTPase regulator-interacting protein 1 isoform X7 [Acipenser ruthenus]
MSLVIDETVGDLPVKDVGLQPNVISAVQDAVHNVKTWRKPQVLKMRESDVKARQRVSKVTREALEDHFLRQHEENLLLKQHVRRQEEKSKRMATKLLRLSSGAGLPVRDCELEDMVEELQDRVSSLEQQKEALRCKLSVARQLLQIQGGRQHSPYSHVPSRINMGHSSTHKGLRVQGSNMGVRRSTQTAPPRCGPNALDEARAEIERLATISEAQNSKMAELEQTAQLLKETMRSKESAIEDTLYQLRNQQAEEHRVTIRENVDLIRLQKQLSGKSTALLVMQEKCKALQEVYETQLEESQKALKLSHNSLLEKVEELTEQLKEETQRNITLENQLETASISQRALEEFQERITDLENEKALLKQDYDKLLESTLDLDTQRSWREGEAALRKEVCRLEDALHTELSEKRQALEQREREREISESLRERHLSLEQEILQQREEMTSLQLKLDFITKECDLSLEDLSETLMQIKTFRLQRANEQLDSLQKEEGSGKGEELSRSFRELQASHAETILELEKTRDMLILQHKINKDYQTELQAVMRNVEADKEESKRKQEQSTRLLELRANRIHTVEGSRGQSCGILEYWLRLGIPVERTVRLHQDRMTALGYLSSHRDRLQESRSLSSQHVLGDGSGGISCELEVCVESCSGLSARWPGLLPDAYVVYKLYDLPDHDSPIIPCSADPVFRNQATFHLPMTFDLQRYLRFESLWIYIFDDADSEQTAYLGKASVPLISLALGKDVRGDFILRDPAGRPNGSIKVCLSWKSPYQPPGTALRQAAETIEQLLEREREPSVGAPPRHTPIAKPRVRAQPGHTPIAKPRRKLVSSLAQAPPRLMTQTEKNIQNTTAKQQARPPPARTVPPQHPPAHRRKKLRLAMPPSPPDTVRGEQEEERGVAEDAMEEEEAGQAVESEYSGRSEEAHVSEEVESEVSAQEEACDVTAESSETQSTDSDVIVISPPRPTQQGSERVRVEILSLTFDPQSPVALDEGVQRVYVEYRLLGVPMEMTETPISLRTPREGEEVHYNFTRVIYVDRTVNSALRQYLYTMLEGTDPNQGRLKFTVVSEPMNEQEEECVDVGHAYLDLTEILRTGNDVIEQQIDIVSVGNPDESIGKLKVSLEAAKTLCSIYWEFKNLCKEEEEELD